MRNNKKNKALRVIFAVMAATAAAVSTAVVFIKRHVKASRNIIFSLIAAVMLCGMMGATAYAYTEPDAEREVDLDEILTPVVTPDRHPNPSR